MKKCIAAGIGSALVLVILAACGMATGDEAVKKMSAEEKAFLAEKLMKITPDQSEEQVTKILGRPHRGGGTMRPTWLAPGGNPVSQVALYYFNGKIFKIRWMKLGSFAWERNFRESMR